MKGAGGRPPPGPGPALRSPLPRGRAARVFPGVAGGGASWLRLSGRGTGGLGRAGVAGASGVGGGREVGSREGEGGGDVAAAQVGGAGQRREAEPPRRRCRAGPAPPREVLETPGAARVRVSVPPAWQPGTPRGSGTGRGHRAEPSARAWPGAGGRGSRPPPWFCTRVGSCPAAESPPRAKRGEVSGALPAGPLGAAGPGGERGRPEGQAPGKGRPGPRTPGAWRRQGSRAGL